MKMSSLAGLLIAACPLLFTGCQQESAKSPSSTEPTPRTLSILSWPDYFPETVLTRFTEETGIEVAYHTFDNTDELEGRLSSSPELFDIIIADDHTALGLLKLQLCGELDHSQLENLKNLDAPYRKLGFDPGNRYSVPYLWGSTLLVYDEGLIGEVEEPSWSLLWDQEKLGGQKIYMVDEVYDYFAVAMLNIGQSFNDLEEDGVGEAVAELERQAQTMNVEYTDAISIRDKLAAGECAAALMYSGDAMLAAEENEDLHVTIPVEGALLWIDSFMLSREAPNPKGAHQFINYILDAEIAAECANENWSASPNLAAKPFLDTELLEDPAVYPAPEVLDRCEFLDREKLEMTKEIYGSLHGLRGLLEEAQQRDS